MNNMQENFETMKTKFEGKLKEWGAEIDKLEAKAQQAGAEGHSELNEQMAELKEKRNEAKKRLSEFSNSSKDTMIDAKARVDKAWTELGATFDKVKARVN